MLKKFAVAMLTVMAISIATPALASDYMGNSKSMKFHYSDCRTIKHPDASYWEYFDSREDAINAGYKPCGICKP